MIVKARITGVFGDTPVVEEGDVELKTGATLKTLFKQGDKALGFKKTKFFKTALKMKNAPTILLNGDRIDLPEAFNQVLEDGDEVTVMSPIMGG